jgi:hypothetical protein
MQPDKLLDERMIWNENHMQRNVTLEYGGVLRRSSPSMSH